MTKPLLRMTEYVDSLPRGLASYPDYLLKASAYREYINQVGIRDFGEIDHLPTVLRDLIVRPAPVTSWIPEVHAYALFMALADLYYPSDEQFMAHKLEANRRMLNGPLYRILFAFMTPKSICENAAARWAKFHRGLMLRLINIAPNSATLRIDFPHNLVPHLQAMGYAVVFKAVLEAAGGKSVDLQLASLGPTFLTLDGVWT